MQYKFLLLAFLYSVNGFPHSNKPVKNIQRTALLPPQMLIPIFGTDLESIITLRALASSIITNLRNEFTGDRLFLQVFYPSSDSFIYISISLVFVYGQWKFIQGSQSIEKFQKIEAFNKREKFIKNIIFILLFVFTKDVLSAT